MTNSAYDVIVIGAGHNGLAAAATLASKGKSVCVIEQNDTAGGMARNHEIVPGVMAPEIAHLLYNLSPVVAQDLGLTGTLQTRALPTVSLAENGQHVVIRDGVATYTSGAPHPDQAAYQVLHHRLVKFAALLSRLSDRSPPALQGGLTSLASVRELAGLAKLGLDLKRLGKAEMREFLRILLSNAYDLILDDLADGPLAGAMAADAVRGSFNGPRAPGTVFTLMYRMGQGGGASLPIGGMGAVSDAFQTAALSRGVEIRTGVGVAQVIIHGDSVRGVELDDGTCLDARAVLTSTGAFQAMQMADPTHFDIEAVRRLRNLRNKGIAAKVNLVLKDAPDITGLSRDLTGSRLLIAPSANYVERAFNPAKYGEMSRSPVIEAVIPTLTDPSLASDRRHLLSAVVQYAPYALDGGWTDAARDRLTRLTLETLAKFAPGLPDLVTACTVFSPADIEAMTGAPGGHWHHAEMGFDQVLTLRPANGMARYRLGPAGYYLCGASAHPGGDVMGSAGRNSALQLLKDGVLA